MTGTNNYEIEAIVSFDERGQLVIPKDLRKKFNLKAGDKFALISCMATEEGSACSTESTPQESSCCAPNVDESSICCFTLINTKQLRNIVAKSLSPAMSKIFST